MWLETDSGNHHEVHLNLMPLHLHYMSHALNNWFYDYNILHEMKIAFTFIAKTNGCGISVIYMQGQKVIVVWRLYEYNEDLIDVEHDKNSLAWPAAI